MSLTHVNNIMKIPSKMFSILNKIIIKQKHKQLRRKLQTEIYQDSELDKVGMVPTIDDVAINCIASNYPIDKIYNEIASFLLNCGQPGIAQHYFKLSMKCLPNPATYSLYLQCLLLDPHCSDETIYSFACQYNTQFHAKTKQYTSFTNPKTCNRKLNIGYICHFFHNSVSQSLLVPFVKAHDRERVKIFCYSDTDLHEVPDHIKQCGDVWHDTKSMNDAALAELIRKEQIDVLLELNGHCFLNRYGVIARRAAPVQVSYYNQCGTTGMPTLDYVLVGDEVSLDKSSPFYSEAIYYIKGVTGIAKFPDSFPPCASAPFLKNDYVTFGSFGASHKVNAEVIKLWAKVLNKVPNSKFFMKAGPLTHDAYLNVYKKLFRDAGVQRDRVYFEGFSEHHKMLERYSDVDIALDTFPYAAGTTTMEATWQGVPVVTLAGDKYCSQNGKIILGSVGHPELVAYSEAEFIDKAAALANNKEQIVKYRKELREDFRKSPRADAKGFATTLEDAYFDMWKRYCERV